MALEAVEEKPAQRRFVGHRPEPTLRPGPLELRFLLRAPLPQPLLAPLATADRLEALPIALEVEILLDEDHLHLAEEADDMIGKLHVIAMLLDDGRPLSQRALRGDLVELGVGIALELRPAALVEEEPAPLADERPHGSGVNDAGRRCKQAVDDVRVVLHRQLEKLHNRVDREIMAAAAAAEGLGIDDMMGLELLEPGWRRAEAGDRTPEVGKEVLLRWNREAVEVEVARVAGNAIRDASHDRLVHDVGGEPPRGLHKPPASEVFECAHRMGLSRRGPANF